MHRGQVHSLLLLLARGAGAAAVAADADATAGSTLTAAPSCGTTSHPSSVAKKASLRSSMGGADGCTRSRAGAGACAADADADADTDADTAAGTARATGKFCTFIPPEALAFVLELLPALALAPRWQVAWWSARFRLGTSWPQSEQITCSSCSPSSSCRCDDRWRVSRGDRRIPSPPPVVPAGEAVLSDGSGGSFRLGLREELMVVLDLICSDDEENE